MTDVFPVLGIVECLAGLILHGAGIFAIILRDRKTNQTLVLFWLSFVEALLLIQGIIGQSLTLFYTTYSWHRNVFLQVFTICNLTSLFTLFFTMYILTADRLVCILTPLKHRIYFPRRRMKIVIMMSWIVSFLLGMLQYSLREIPVIQHMAIGIGALYIILVIITYSIIIYKVQQSRRRFRSSRTTQPRQVLKFRKEFLLPTMIIFNFIILFYVTLVLITVTGRQQHYILQSCLLLQYFGLLCDPLIYVLLTKHYRDIFVTKCLPCQQSNEARSSDMHLANRTMEQPQKEAQATTSHDL